MASLRANIGQVFQACNVARKYSSGSWHDKECRVRTAHSDSKWAKHLDFSACAVRNLRLLTYGAMPFGYCALRGLINASKQLDYQKNSLVWS